MRLNRERANFAAFRLFPPMPNTPDPLDELFKAYPAPPPLAADFKAQVQHRIAVQAAPFSTAWWRRLERVFAQPAFAAVFVCACVLFGLLVAEMRLGAERARTHARVVDSYIQLINPRIEPADNAPLPSAPRAQEVPS